MHCFFNIARYIAEKINIIKIIYFLFNYKGIFFITYKNTHKLKTCLKIKREIYAIFIFIDTCLSRITDN